MTSPEFVVTAAIAPLQAEPRAGSEQVSQRLAGHFLTLLEERGPWLRVRGSDDYEGWVHAGYVRRLAADVKRRQYDSGCVSLGCVIRDAEGRRRSLPLGALLAEGDAVERGTALPRAELISRFPRTGAAIACTAQEFFEGTPYQWGGITPWGADCSGLVQMCFGLHGVALPRDTWQQALLGRDLGTDLEALHAGDLLFFADRPDARISHVAIALGPAEIVHLALGRGGYATERLNRRDDPYVAALADRLRCARRMDL